jgi:hypothetical protein
MMMPIGKAEKAMLTVVAWAVIMAAAYSIEQLFEWMLLQ